MNTNKDETIKTFTQQEFLEAAREVLRRGKEDPKLHKSIIGIYKGYNPDGTARIELGKDFLEKVFELLDQK